MSQARRLQIVSTFDILYNEGKQGNPKMMSIGLHCRLAGRPGRMKAIQEFVNYVNKHSISHDRNVRLNNRLEVSRSKSQLQSLILLILRIHATFFGGIHHGFKM